MQGKSNRLLITRDMTPRQTSNDWIWT